MKKLKLEEAITILQDMKVDIPVPKAAVMQTKRNVALDMAIDALKCSEMPNVEPEPSQVARDIATILENEKDMRVILSQPERKKGKWINIRHDNIAECDQCGITGRAWMNFCFDCGVDMRETYDGSVDKGVER